VQGYKAVQEEHRKQADEYAEIVAKRRAEAEERDRRATEAMKQENEQGSGGEDGKVIGDEKNVAKANKEKRGDSVPQEGANEKARMMDQMNSNKRESSPEGGDGRGADYEQ
jgi:hypothetical protein